MRSVFLSMLALGVLVSSCKKNSEPQTGSLKITLKQCGQIHLGGRNVNICFNSVEDGRCPWPMECFWEGVAKASFTINEGSRSRSFNLGTTPVYEGYPQETEVFGYKIRFVALRPFASLPPTTPPTPYEAELEITK